MLCQNRGNSFKILHQFALEIKKIARSSLTADKAKAKIQELKAKAIALNAKQKWTDQTPDIEKFIDLFVEIAQHNGHCDQVIDILSGKDNAPPASPSFFNRTLINDRFTERDQLRRQVGEEKLNGIYSEVKAAQNNLAHMNEADLDYAFAYSLDIEYTGNGMSQAKEGRIRNLALAIKIIEHLKKTPRTFVEVTCFYEFLAKIVYSDIKIKFDKIQLKSLLELFKSDICRGLPSQNNDVPVNRLFIESYRAYCEGTVDPILPEIFYEVFHPFSHSQVGASASSASLFSAKKRLAEFEFANYSDKPKLYCTNRDLNSDSYDTMIDDFFVSMGEHYHTGIFEGENGIFAHVEQNPWNFSQHLDKFIKKIQTVPPEISCAETVKILNFILILVSKLKLLPHTVGSEILKLYALVEQLLLQNPSLQLDSFDHGQKSVVKGIVKSIFANPFEFESVLLGADLVEKYASFFEASEIQSIIFQIANHNYRYSPHLNQNLSDLHRQSSQSRDKLKQFNKIFLKLVKAYGAAFTRQENKSINANDSRKLMDIIEQYIHDLSLTEHTYPIQAENDANAFAEMTTSLLTNTDQKRLIRWYLSRGDLDRAFATRPYFYTAFLIAMFYAPDIKPPTVQFWEAYGFIKRYSYNYERAGALPDFIAVCKVIFQTSQSSSSAAAKTTYQDFVEALSWKDETLLTQSLSNPHKQNAALAIFLLFATQDFTQTVGDQPAPVFIQQGSAFSPAETENIMAAFEVARQLHAGGTVRALIGSPELPKALANLVAGQLGLVSDFHDGLPPAQPENEQLAAPDQAAAVLVVPGENLVVPLDEN